MSIAEGQRQAAPSALSVILLTSAALVGFASNSLLCRAALLSGGVIDPATFTTIRIVSGAITLALIVALRSRSRSIASGDWASAAALFLYAVAFSFAYVRLTTSTGALILFGVVQVTMLVAAFRGGERSTAAQVMGLLLALSGLIVLCAPGVRAPDPVGAALMALAGIAWGAYSLRGRKSGGDPLAATAGNFVRAAALTLPLLGLFYADLQLTTAGVLLAIASGALASGIGYTLWYSALPHLTATRASIVQLSVPVLAAIGGVLLLREAVTFRIVAATAATLGGVLLAMRRRPRGAEPSPRRHPADARQ